TPEDRQHEVVAHGRKILEDRRETFVPIHRRMRHDGN
ncbi:unnamed protein product, partial [Didymodactylos carnosus]